MKKKAMVNLSKDKGLKEGTAECEHCGNTIFQVVFSDNWGDHYMVICIRCKKEDYL